MTHKTAFVTGSTGLLGSNLVTMLEEQGWAVKAMARSREKAERVLAHTNAEIVLGDMQNIPAWAEELNGVDVVFHCAAYFREFLQPGEHWPILQAVNIDGTIELLNAAQERGVGKVIYTSSSGVMQHPGDGTPIDENAPYLNGDTENLYFKSKVLAEEAIYAWLEDNPLPVVLILPGWMHGPRDAAPTTAGQLVLDFMEGSLPAIIQGGQMVVDVRDVVQGMINAVEQGRPGERYLIGGQHATLEDILYTLQDVTGRPAPRMKMPTPAAMAVAWVSQTAASLTGGETLMTVNGLRTLVNGMRERVDSSKAQAELGVSFRPLSDTLRASAEWYKEHGCV